MKRKDARNDGGRLGRMKPSGERGGLRRRESKVRGAREMLRGQEMSTKVYRENRSKERGDETDSTQEREERQKIKKKKKGSKEAKNKI